MRGVRIPMSLVVRRKGAPVLLGWLLMLAGAAAAIVSLVRLDFPIVAVGLAVGGVGFWILRRGIQKGYRAYGWRRER